MESFKPNVLFDFNENQLENVRKSCDYDVSKLTQDIDLFEEWIAKQNHFRVRKFENGHTYLLLRVHAQSSPAAVRVTLAPEDGARKAPKLLDSFQLLIINRGYLERYLIYNKGSLERAKKHFDNLCCARNYLPEFLQNFELSQFEKLRSCHKLAIIKKPTPDNYRIAISSLHGNHDNMDVALYYKYIIMVIEYLMFHDYCNGWVLVFDTREMPYSMLTKLNPLVIGKALSLILDTMGQRTKGFHCLSGSKFFDTILSLFKQAMSQKMASRVYVHENLESLQAVLGTDGWPIEYGGSVKTLQEFDDDIYKELNSKEHIERMKFLESASTDESCRLTPKPYDGTPGSFKTINID